MENKSIRLAKNVDKIRRKLWEDLYILNTLTLPSNARNVHRSVGLLNTSSAWTVAAFRFSKPNFSKMRAM